MTGLQDYRMTGLQEEKNKYLCRPFELRIQTADVA